MDTSTDQMPAPRKKNRTGLIILLIIIALVVAAFLFGTRKTNDTIPRSTATTTQGGDDLSSIQADVEATNFDDMSDGL